MVVARFAAGTPPFEDNVFKFRTSTALGGAEDTSGDRSRWSVMRADSAAEVEELLRLARARGATESYVEPLYALPFVPPSSAVPALSGELPQRHLDEAPEGLGVRLAWKSASPPGEGVCAGHIECAWTSRHVDFHSAGRRLDLSVAGKASVADYWVGHGTACLGLGVASNNGLGTSGIAWGTSKVRCFVLDREAPLAEVIETATKTLSPGDALLLSLEMQVAGARKAPAEYLDANYEQVRRASKKGIIVVEAAGNGGDDLDHEIFGGRFTTRERSGAILVGAGAPPEGSARDRSRILSSNYGSRVDVQGYGLSICTTGYGDLTAANLKAIPEEHYTGVFGGTSGAAAMVWGAVLLLQGEAKRQGRWISPQRMRDLLVDTGSTQQDFGSSTLAQRIGPRPNLAAALQRIVAYSEIA